MSIVAQLFQLQEVELEIEAREASVKKMNAELGEDQGRAIEAGRREEAPGRSIVSAALD